MSLRWSPPVELSRSEEMVIKRCSKRKLFIFLRRHRHEIFDDEMQAALASAYDERRRGEEPVPPAQLAMAALLVIPFSLRSCLMRSIAIFSMSGGSRFIAA